MRFDRYCCFATLLAGALFLAAPSSQAAQLSIQIGPAPVCPYGYYDVAPYRCAPYGYYGPEWFQGGLFVGAGPWFHGSRDFHGHVDNRYDPHHGYRGAYPHRGEHASQHGESHFRGNEVRDGRGHADRGHADNGHGHGDNGHGHDQGH